MRTFSVEALSKQCALWNQSKCSLLILNDLFAFGTDVHCEREQIIALGRRMSSRPGCRAMSPFSQKSFFIWMMSVSVEASKQCCVSSSCATHLQGSVPSTFASFQFAANTAVGKKLGQGRGENDSNEWACRALPAALNLRGGSGLVGKRKRQHSPMAVQETKRCRPTAEMRHASEERGNASSVISGQQRPSTAGNTNTFPAKMGSSAQEDSEVCDSAGREDSNEYRSECDKSDEDDLGAEAGEARSESALHLDEEKKSSGGTQRHANGARPQPAWFPPPLSAGSGANGRLHPDKPSSPTPGWPQKLDQGPTGGGGAVGIRIDLGNLCGFDPGADPGPIYSDATGGEYADFVQSKARLVLLSMVKELQSQEPPVKTPHGSTEVILIARAFDHLDLGSWMG